MEIILSHSGAIKFETINNLIGQLKEKTSVLGLKMVTYKKILLVIIESLENIYKYNHDLDSKNKQYLNNTPEFLLERNNKKYKITTTNAVLNSDIKLLEDKIISLNNLDDDGIRDLYRTTITDGVFTDQGGAGLGIIEIAKIASEKLEYRFEPIDDKFSYYHLIITVNED
ncbi:MAG: SiaB family protein kinase [Bacteroidales bacterium]|nr:SiaB family protein kinase [Bacteroidales bacterium]